MNYLKNEKGHTLILTIILLALVVILGMALLGSLASEIKMNKNMEENYIGTYLAQAGIEHGLKILENTQKDKDPIKPTSAIPVYSAENNIYEYEIVELNHSLVKAKGRIKVGGVVTKEITIGVKIEEGKMIEVDTE